MKRITQTKEIQTGDNSGVVISGVEKISYSESFPLASYTDDELITKSAVVELIAEQVPSSSSINPWNPLAPTDEDDYVTIIIDDFEYLFRSNEDGNLTEPILPNGTSQTWSLVGISALQLPREWSVTPTPLNAIRWIEIDAVTYQFASLIDGNVSEPSLVNADWLLLGTKAGGEPPLIFNQSDLIEEIFGGAWYLEMDVPDGLEVGSVAYKEGTVTNRLSIDNAVTDTTNTPNTRISGFPNNNTQTITIKLI